LKPPVQPPELQVEPFVKRSAPLPMGSGSDCELDEVPL